MPVSTRYRATWGGRSTKLIQDLDLDTGRINFQTPNMGVRNGADTNEAPNIKSQMSMSAPNISQTIINPESLVPISFTKMEKVKNIMREVSIIIICI